MDVDSDLTDNQLPKPCNLKLKLQCLNIKIELISFKTETEKRVCICIWPNFRETENRGFSSGFFKTGGQNSGFKTRFHQL